MRNRQIRKLLLAAACALCLTACGSNKDISGKTTENAAKESEAEAGEVNDAAESGTEEAADSSKKSKAGKADGVTESEAGENAEDADGAAETGTEEPQEDAAVFGDFQTLTLTGEEASQEIFADADLTMVNIWGTFCGPCLREMPDLGDLSREYADSGFQIVGIITDVTETEDETAMEILEETGADYTHLLISRELYDNYLWQVQVVPTTIFVDSQGKQVGIYTGSRSKEDWTEIIEEMRGKVSDEE